MDISARHRIPNPKQVMTSKSFKKKCTCNRYTHDTAGTQSRIKHRHETAQRGQEPKYGIDYQRQQDRSKNEKAKRMLVWMPLYYATWLQVYKALMVRSFDSRYNLQSTNLNYLKVPVAIYHSGYYPIPLLKISR